MLKIDAHTHILPKKMPNWSDKFGYGDFIYPSFLLVADQQASE